MNFKYYTMLLGKKWLRCSVLKLLNNSPIVLTLLQKNIYNNSKQINNKKDVFMFFIVRSTYIRSL